MGIIRKFLNSKELRATVLNVTYTEFTLDYT
jgi:hypothetical protein